MKAMRGEAELSAYEIGYVCGAGRRVAEVALVRLWSGGLVKIYPNLAQVRVLETQARDDVETAVLDEIGKARKYVAHVLETVAESEPVTQIGRTLAEEELIGGAFWKRRHAQREMRRRLTERYEDWDGLERIAVLGPSAIEDEKIRNVFISPAPARGKVVANARRAAIKPGGDVSQNPQNPHFYT